MTLTGLLLFSGVYALAVATPGPGIALIVARTMAKGRVGLGWFLAGFALGDVALFLIAASGLAIVAQTFETGFAVIRYAGAAYLVWIAWKIWTAPAAALDLSARPDGENALGAFLSSFLLTLGNPKAIVFFMSIMPLVVDLRALNLATVLELVALIVAIIVPVLGAVALMADRARRLFRSQRAVRALNRTTAGVMAGAAVAIAAR